MIKDGKRETSSEQNKRTWNADSQKAHRHVQTNFPASCNEENVRRMQRKTVFLKKQSLHPNLIQVKQNKSQNASEKILQSAATETLKVLRPVNRETNYEYFQRKREMFLIEFSLQIKRNEIARYKDRAVEEENKASLVGYQQSSHKNKISLLCMRQKGVC